LNVAKSKGTGLTSVTSRTEVWEATPDGGVKVTRTAQRADGTKSDRIQTFKYDGKEYSYGEGRWDTISFKRIDANTLEFEVKKAGVAYHEMGRIVISKDGKTKTVTIKGNDTQGKAVDVMDISDKQ
jgi:hypothetical protein